MDNKDNSNNIYTLGMWTVKPGKEKQFINEWTSFAKWSDKNISGSGKAYLLQDKNNPLHFISYGTWVDQKSIDHWRETNDFKNFVTKVKSLCEDFQPNTLNLVSTSK